MSGGKCEWWDLAMTAAELAWENRRARQGKRDETAHHWMRRLTRTGRLGCFYQKSVVLLIPMWVFCHLVKEIAQNLNADH